MKARDRRGVRVRRELREVGLTHALPSEWGRLARKGLRRPCLLAAQGRRGYGALFYRKERTARLTIEKENKATLRNLRDRVDAPPAARDGDEIGRGREVAIPDVVMHRLKVPETLPGLGVEREQRVGEQVRADPIAAIKVRRRRPSRDVDNAPPNVDGHPRPRIRAAGSLPCIGRPGVVAEFTRVRNRVKGPADPSAAHVVGAHIPRR